MADNDKTRVEIVIEHIEDVKEHRGEEAYNQMESRCLQDISVSAAKLVDSYTNLKSAKAPIITESISTPADVQTFTDGADNLPVNTLTVGIDPVQDLHGQDVPYPPGGGKNKAHITYTSDTVGGITITVNSDGTFTTGGTASEDKTILIGTYDGVSGTGYTLTGCPSGGGSSTYRLFASSIGNDNGDGATGTYNSGATNILLQFYSGANMNGLTFKPMVRLSSVSDATYAPYSNICPITGWTGANVTRTGKNLLPNKKVSFSTHTWIGTDSTTSVFYFSLKPGTYTLSANLLTNGTLWMRKSKGATNERISSLAESKNPYGTFTVAEEDSYRFWVNNVSPENVVNFQLELGSTASEYTPYSGSTAEYEFPQEAGTVYGGTLTIHQDGSGELVVTHGIVDLGTINWNYLSSYPYFYTSLSSLGAKSTELNTEKLENYCSIYKSVSFNNLGSGFTVTYYQNNARIKDTRFTDATNFKNAMSGVMYCFELATPVTYQLTNQQVIELLSFNNIWADTGKINAVDYPADTKMYIAKVIAELGR